MEFIASIVLLARECATEKHIIILDKYAFGDINKDGQIDAVVILKHQILSDKQVILDTDSEEILAGVIRKFGVLANVGHNFDLQFDLGVVSTFVKDITVNTADGTINLLVSTKRIASSPPQDRNIVFKFNPATNYFEIVK